MHINFLGSCSGPLTFVDVEEIRLDPLGSSPLVINGDLRLRENIIGTDLNDIILQPNAGKKIVCNTNTTLAVPAGVMLIEVLQFKVVSDSIQLLVSLRVMMELTGVLLVVSKTLTRILTLFLRLLLVQTRTSCTSTMMVPTRCVLLHLHLNSTP
ncbi:MAG: hypothetical protein CM15mV3_0410 [Caudoviricetes sp.]|nr:MAG: hypothetical protein CM15mV3_0410 [Caudoviricetes sp.]